MSEDHVMIQQVKLFLVMAAPFGMPVVAAQFSVPC